jgi:hypothetical protein
VIKLSGGLHVQYRLLLSDFNKTWIFWTDFRKKNVKTWNFVTSGASRIVALGQTDGQEEDNSRFSPFSEGA